MRSSVPDLSGSAFLSYPMERHPFEQSAENGFLCSVCRRPRALHRTPEQPTIPSNLNPGTARIRSLWPSVSVGKRLSDKKIAQYAARGFYSAEFHQARREHMARKSSKNGKRNNFDTVDGRLIYRP